MQSIEDVYLENSKLVYKYLLCLTRDSELAEELTQDTFVCAINEISDFKNNCKISTWLCQIAKNLWYKHLKKITKSNIISIENIDKDIKNTDNVENEVINRYQKQELYSKIEQFPDELKEVIYLRIIGELSFKQIGEVIGKNENWARVTFYRCKEKMKEGDLDEK